MKRSNLVSVLVLFLLSLSSFGIVSLTWERPIFMANMKMESGKYEFERAERISLMLTKNDSSTLPTGIRLTYQLSVDCPVTHDKWVDDEQGNCQSKLDKSYLLTISDIREAGCGSVEYIASLINENGALGGERVSIVLTDHSKRICEDYRPYVWTASVRKGYGWCGTGDSTMEIVGNPHIIYTIQ